MIGEVRWWIHGNLDGEQIALVLILQASKSVTVSNQPLVAILPSANSI